MSEARVLCVDDEPNILSGLQRFLRGRYESITTTSPTQALDLMRTGEPFAVVLSDMRMPAMDGAQFLAQARRVAPDTTRVMLTGNSDQATAARAVNEGAIFRFLLKPCRSDELLSTLEEGVELFNRQRTERELLKQTLRGTVRVLTEILGLVDPDAFGRSSRLRVLAASLATSACVERAWEFEIAAMLLDLGLVALPPDLRRKMSRGEALTAEERSVVARVPELGQRWLEQIPRLEGVAQVVGLVGAHRLAPMLGGKHSLDARAPLGARLLAPLLDWLAAEDEGLAVAAAWQRVQRHPVFADAELRADFENWVSVRSAAKSARTDQTSKLPLAELKAGHVLAAPILTTEGRTLIAAGNVLNGVVLERIRNHAKLSGVREPIEVLGAEGSASGAPNAGSSSTDIALP
jgi:response regulator RpfG family c-di-GMP phosphodiesterase